MIPMDADIDQIQKEKVVEQQKVNNNVLKYHYVYSKAGFLASIIKIPSKTDKNLTFAELPRTLEDEQKIDDLISSMGIHGKLTLLLHHEKRLRKIGDELRYLHPFKFLGFIFSPKNSHLKQHMGEIFDDYFKRTNFVKDYSQTMDIYDLKNDLTVYLEDFSKEVDIPANEILPFIKDKNWEGLVRFLIKY